MPSGTTSSPSGTSPLSAIEPLLLEEHHRVRVANRRGEQTFHVGRLRRRDDLQARDRHRPVLDRLRVLRAEAEPAAVGRADDERQRDLTVGHVARLGDLVGDDVPADGEEVGEHDLARSDASPSSPRPSRRRGSPARRSACRARAPGRTRSSRPTVALKTPPAAATSSPMKTTFGSRSISCAIPAATASRYVSSATLRLRRPRRRSRASLALGGAAGLRLFGRRGRLSRRPRRRSRPVRLASTPRSSRRAR